MLVLIVVIGVIGMSLITPVDYEWTHFLRENKWDGFKDFMSDSMFEGERIGGSDFAVIYLIVIGALYLWAWIKPNKPWLIRWRPYLGFVLCSSLFSAVYYIHTTKWLMARARPKLVFRGEMPFSDWFEVGPHFIANGVFRGSFPSGHTAIVFVYITLAYILFCGGNGWKSKTGGVLIGLWAFAYAFMMGIARSMGAAHWLSDNIAAVCVGWAITHITFFWGLRIPEQINFLKEKGHLPKYKFLFEAWICFYLFLVCLGFMGLCVGIRAVTINNCPWLVFMSPIGLFFIIFFGIKTWQAGLFRPLTSPPLMKPLKTDE